MMPLPSLPVARGAELTGFYCVLAAYGAAPDYLAHRCESARLNGGPHAPRWQQWIGSPKPASQTPAVNGVYER